MSEIIYFNMVTPDGFFSGADGNIDWHNVDAEFNEFAIQQLDSAGGLIFGRKTYELMAQYWPTPMALQDDQQVAARMNAIPKLVFSRSLKAAPWNNTRLLNDPAGPEFSQIRRQPGRPWFIFGSANLAASMIPHGLVDEYRLMVAPVLLGSGVPLFQGLRQLQRLSLVRTKTFGNGNILLVYRPLKDAA